MGKKNKSLSEEVNRWDLSDSHCGRARLSEALAHQDELKGIIVAKNCKSQRTMGEVVVVDVVGTFACSFPIPKSPTLSLQNEPTNIHDNMAVMVMMDGNKIGYVPRSANSTIREGTVTIVSHAFFCVNGNFKAKLKCSPLAPINS